MTCGVIRTTDMRALVYIYIHTYMYIIPEWIIPTEMPSLSTIYRNSIHYCTHIDGLRSTLVCLQRYRNGFDQYIGGFVHVNSLPRSDELYLCAASGVC